MIAFRLAGKPYAHNLVLSILLLPSAALALCSSPSEMGRWRNVNATSGVPEVIDVTMIDCGDQVLNGVETQTRYTVRVWLRQSSGQYYGRPTVNAQYGTDKSGGRWIVARVPTGGYVDNMQMRVYDSNGRPQLRVYIRHESLDRKPSATSDLWFKRESK